MKINFRADPIEWADRKMIHLKHSHVATATPTDAEERWRSRAVFAVTVGKWPWQGRSHDSSCDKACKEFGPQVNAQQITHVRVTEAKPAARNRSARERGFRLAGDSSGAEGEHKGNTLRSRLSRCKSSAPLMSCRRKLSLYSPKWSRSSQAATSSVPHFSTTKVKSESPLISTCPTRCEAKAGQRRCKTERSRGASKGVRETPVPALPTQVTAPVMSPWGPDHTHSWRCPCALGASWISSRRHPHDTSHQ